jgi:hypothetical protein
MESIKPSVSLVGKLMWAVFALSTVLLLLDPTVESVEILGISTARSRLVVVGPVAIVGMLLARQAVIRGMIEIVRGSTDTSQIKGEASSTPLPEFIRWKLPISIETVILTAYQAAMFLVPSLAVFETLKCSGCSSVLVYGSTSLVFFLVEWNYHSLRKQVYQQLLGAIKTPD